MIVFYFPFMSRKIYFFNVQLAFIYWLCSESFTTTLWKLALSICLFIFNFGRYNLRKNLESWRVWGIQENPACIYLYWTKKVRAWKVIYRDQHSECCQMMCYFYKQWSHFQWSLSCWQPWLGILSFARILFWKSS